MSFSTTSEDPLVKGFPSQWHRTMELAVLCILNGLSFVMIVARLCVRRSRLGRLFAADYWVITAAVCVVGTWASQIGSNRAGGSGLRWAEDPHSWRVRYWRYVLGWLLYYPACAMLKVSVCASLREILPYSYSKLRMGILFVCAVALSLAIIEVFLALFQCQPVASNWDWRVPTEKCLDLDVARYTWIGVSIAIDIVITWIPLEIIRHTRLKTYERRIILAAFSANLLGTVVCIVEISAIWLNSPRHTDDAEYTGTYFIIMNCLEMFFYSFGASATVFARYAISIASSTLGSSASAIPRKGRWCKGKLGWYYSSRRPHGGDPPPRPTAPRSSQQISNGDRSELVGINTLLRHAEQSNPNSSVDTV